MNPLTIICAGGHGKVVADIAEACGFDQIVFVDDKWPERTENCRWPIVSKPDVSMDGPLFCARGLNEVRAKMFDEFKLSDSPVLIHPAATVSISASIGAGTVVVAGAVVNADANVGRGAILNTGSSVDHDCDLADFVHLSPGARLAGGVTVGARSWIGIGATVADGITIGSDAIVGAGAAVVSDVPDGARVVGVPAKRI